MWFFFYLRTNMFVIFMTCPGCILLDQRFATVILGMLFLNNPMLNLNAMVESKEGNNFICELVLSHYVLAVFTFSEWFIFVHITFNRENFVLFCLVLFACTFHTIKIMNVYFEYFEIFKAFVINFPYMYKMSSTVWIKQLYLTVQHESFSSTFCILFFRFGDIWLCTDPTRCQWWWKSIFSILFNYLHHSSYHHHFNYHYNYHHLSKCRRPNSPKREVRLGCHGWNACKKWRRR